MQGTLPGVSTPTLFGLGSQTFSGPRDWLASHVRDIEGIN